MSLLNFLLCIAGYVCVYSVYTVLSMTISGYESWHSRIWVVCSKYER